MNHRTMANWRPQAMTRSVWALLAVLWLNMAVLPCAMAFESDDHDCPHCPPADEHQMGGHHGHAKREATQQAEASCATMQSQCCDIVDASVDTRSKKSDVRDSSDLEYCAVSSVPEFSVWPAAHYVGAADPPWPPDNFPPRHVLFCVYLD